MNKVLMPLLFGAFILTSSSFAQTSPPAAAPAAVPVAMKSARHDRHPEIHKAVHNLRLAKSHLEDAAHDYGGHKAKAIAAINGALAELHEALQYDNK